MYEVRVPTHKDFLDIKKDVRLADHMEWQAFSGVALSKSVMWLIEDIREGDYARVAVSKKDGKALIFWGVNPSEDFKGHDVWMFCTNEALRHALSLHKTLLPEVKEMIGRFPLINALSDSRNTKHHTWLEWIGFRLLGEDIKGPYSLKYKHYIMERKICVE